MRARSTTLATVLPLDVEPGQFDVVLDNHTLHCLVVSDHRVSFLRYAARALRAGGLFFSETMSREGGFEGGAYDVDPASSVNRSGTRIWVSRVELNAELTVSGFRIVEQRLRPQSERPTPPAI